MECRHDCFLLLDQVAGRNPEVDDHQVHQAKIGDPSSAIDRKLKASNYHAISSRDPMLLEEELLANSSRRDSLDR